LDQDELAWQAFTRTARMVRHRGSTLILMGQDLLKVPLELFGLAGLVAIGAQKNLDNEARFLRDSLCGLRPGTLLLIDTPCCFAPVDRPDEIRRKDPWLSGSGKPNAWRDRVMAFWSGPLRRYVPGVESIDIRMELNLQGQQHPTKLRRRGPRPGAGQQRPGSGLQCISHQAPRHAGAGAGGAGPRLAADRRLALRGGRGLSPGPVPVRKGPPLSPGSFGHAARRAFARRVVAEGKDAGLFPPCYTAVLAAL
jgi:hypothetical protein